MSRRPISLASSPKQWLFNSKKYAVMKKHIVLLSVLLLIEAVAVSVFAKKKAGHEYVDLGLSVKWATCNVGASKPEEAGCHYAWGELEEKDNYIVENYKFYDSDDYYRINKYNSSSLDGKDGFTDDKMILDPEDDVAHEKWGGKWRMPTAEEWDELIEDCTWEWVEVNGMGGYRITGKKPGYKDRSIFLPASGCYLRMDNEFDLYGKIGDYWSSSLSTENYYRPASGFFIDRFEYNKSVTSRHLPKSVRPVCP